jgi:guanyl-specific ribonuclease Sa
MRCFRVVVFLIAWHVLAAWLVTAVSGVEAGFQAGPFTGSAAGDGPVIPGDGGAALAQAPPSYVQAVLEKIQERHGKPLPGYVGGKTFHNRERKLPPARYREYDVHPTRPGRNRGPERLVIDQRTGKAYYTPDHYDTFIPMN